MKKLTLLLALLIPVFAFSQIINIPDDYPTIQEGIDAASNGDTVLVDTGAYVENINFNGKNITVASHYLTTLDTSYISQTVIDGNQNGCVIIFENLEPQSTKLCGFTIVNGLNTEGWPFGNGGGILAIDSSPTLENLIVKNNKSGYEGGGGIACLGGEPILSNIIIRNNGLSSYGGGIYCHGADVSIIDVEIIGNSAYWGGGIYLTSCNPTLQNVIFRDNIALGYGGGMMCYDSSPFLSNVTIKFNTANTNGGGLGCAMGTPVFDSINRCNIYSNTSQTGQLGREITSHVPLHIFLDTFSVLYPTECYIEPLNDIYDINWGIVEQIESDVFVSPEGDDSNDGLSENMPLKTIKNTMPKMRIDSLHYYTIFLLEGEYSTSLTEELFPIHLPSYIDIVGQNQNTVVLNAEEQANVLYLYGNKINKISDFTVTGGSYEGAGAGIGIYYSNAILKSIVLSGNEAKDKGGGVSCWSSNVEMSDMIIRNNSADYWGGGLWSYNTNLTVTNSLISNNSAINTEGGGLGISLSDAILTNVTVTGNNAEEDGGGLYLGGYHSYNNHVSLVNALFWNNEPNEIAMDEPSHDGSNDDKLIIQFSDIQGGQENILPKENDTILWLEGNINQDPLFVNSGNNPYQINDYSPCIDAGTPDTTGLNLPEYDLAGEIRIFNDRVDMGAYEWNTFVGIEDASMPETSELQVNSYPNPFPTSTTIEYTLTQAQVVTITFYNQFGKQVDAIEESQQKGLNRIIWTPEKLADGIYYFRLKVGKQIASGKVVLMK